MLFQRYALIYESSLNQAVHEEAAPPDTSQQHPQMEAPLPVAPVKVPPSSIAVVADEVAGIGSGWWSDPPPPVPPVQIQLGSIEVVADEVPEIGSGWWSDPPPVVLPFPPVYVLDLEQVAEEEVVDDSQEMVFSEFPTLVPPGPPPASDIAVVADDIPDIGSGWFPNPPPIVLPLPPVYSHTNIVYVPEQLPQLGGANSDLVIVHFPYALIYQKNSGPVPDEIPDIGSGWWSDTPLPVPPIQLQLGTIDAILEEIPDIGSGWWGDPPPIVPPIRVPDSSIAFAEEVVAVGPPTRIRRLRELGMGILKRQQLG